MSHVVDSYRFFDTFALFVLFLSINNYCLLFISCCFIIANSYRHFIANLFIGLFLSKRPSSTELLILKKDGVLPSGGDLTNHWMLTLFVFNIFLSIIVKNWAHELIYEPIRIFACSILASSMINKPKYRLYNALICTAILSFLNYFEPSIMLLYNSFAFNSIPATLPFTVPKLHWSAEFINDYFGAKTTFLNKYVDVLSYTLSFHIIISQVWKDFIYKIKNKFSGGGSSQKSNHLSSNYAQRSMHSSPVFSDSVKSFTSYEVDDTDYNSQTVSRENQTTEGLTSINHSNKTGDSVLSQQRMADIQVRKNQFHQLNINELSITKTKNNSMIESISKTSNLENFIRILFQWKKNYMISPLWSMFVTLKATNFEKKYLKEVTASKFHNENSTAFQNGFTNKSDDEGISPVVSGNSINDATQSESKSIFNSQKNNFTTALTTQEVTDDYDQLNLISSKDNILNRGENNYKVCITEINTHSITFHIENLHDGVLIVLVNGVIWSEVSCAVVLKREGEEDVVVNGLVPFCLYDIQFVNRLEEVNDYLIGDISVRTKRIGNNSEELDTSSENDDSGFKEFELEKLDFTTPSYYHRTFVSPFLTLQHSILTTNANLIGERTKLKKTKKEVTKKLTVLNQEIDNYKKKLRQNTTNDEKLTLKIDNLKIAMQQSEAKSSDLEEKLKELTDNELVVEEAFLKNKKIELKKSLEAGRQEEKLVAELDAMNKKLLKMGADHQRQIHKRDKLATQIEKLKNDIIHTTNESEQLKAQFLANREKQRLNRREARAHASNQYELTIKGLEQDLSRIEQENNNMQMLMSNLHSL